MFWSGSDQLQQQSLEPGVIQNSLCVLAFTSLEGYIFNQCLLVIVCGFPLPKPQGKSLLLIFISSF